MNTEYKNSKSENRGFVRNAILLAGAAAAIGTAYGGAYAYTGDKDKFYRHGSAKNLGVGSGAVFSIQYQF